jgi:purine-binding chemotaxis protein CheW
MFKRLAHTFRTLLRSGVDATSGSVRHCLTFTLNGIRFGIDTRTVNEIVRLGILAAPRDMPECLRALYRHKGTMIPVVDIAARHGHQALRQGGRSCLVVVRVGRGKLRRDIGLMVDEVLGVEKFAASSLKPVPENVCETIQVEIIEGVVALETDGLIVLDGWKLLSDEKLEEISAYMRQI